ncbi:MAG: aminotransferase class III-fold pyridoxal phosphate-dependent enzyme [Actinomycetia bacterium]|nr:aminotransferase class III-fold pyridoxal phosphate-dependent enzyme [Actinomycetes bacterium]
MSTLDRTRLTSLIERERATYAENHPKSRAAFTVAQQNLFGGVPMTWMTKWSGGFPLYLDAAHGNRISDIDGHTYVDFALGDTGAMAGHSPDATVQAITERIGPKGGFTTMLPSEDAAWVGAELARRFGLPLWSFALTATDANRWALRLARLATGKSKVLAFSYCYHGSVDETVVIMGADGSTEPRPGNAGPAVHPAETTRVAEFNDLSSVERALANGDVAVVITEPALTNIGIVLPEPGFLEGVRTLCTKYGALLLIDETHTFSAGPGGMTKAEGLDPDILVIGKSIAGGIPIGTYGISRGLADEINSHDEADLIDVGGVGGTLAGNALSIAAAKATLGEVLTDDAFAEMIALATRFTEGVQGVLDTVDVPWSISQLGARAEYRFARPAPVNGTESNKAGDDDLDEYMHLYTLNRGVLMTPFHNMALMCPSTSEADVDLHTEVFTKAINELYA